MKTELFRRCWDMRRFFAEDSRFRVESQDHTQPVAPWCEYYDFTEKVTQEATLEDGTTRTITDWKDIPGRYFPGGRIVSKDEIPLGEIFDILRSNAECNGWDRLVCTRNGRWQPFQDGDVMIDKYTIDNDIKR